MVNKLKLELITTIAQNGGSNMNKDMKQFFNLTSKKLEMIEKKIQEMKLNIIVMSFYADLKLIEDTLLNYEAQGIKIDESLFEKIEKFKILLQSNKDLPTLGKNFIEVTEEFYKLRKKIHGPDDLEKTVNDEIVSDELTDNKKKHELSFLSAYA